MAKSKGKSTFVKGFDAKQSAYWNKKARKEEDTFGVNVPDGIYDTVLSKATFGENKKYDCPQVTLTFVVSDGDCEGKQINKNYTFRDASDNFKVEDVMRMFAIDLKRLDLDVEDMDLGDVEDAVKGLVKEETECSIKVATSGQYSNAYIQGRLEDSDEEEDEDEEDDDEGDEEEEEDDEDGEEEEEDEEDEDEEDEEDEEESDEDDEEEDEDDEEEEEEADPEKGDYYMYKPAKGKKKADKEEAACRVTGVSVKNGTVTLRRVDDNETFKGVSFDELGDWIDPDDDDVPF